MKWKFSDSTPAPARAYFEGMAAARGLSVPDWLRSVVVIEPDTKTIKCKECGEPQSQEGAFPELDPNQAKGMPFRTTIAIRIFVNRWVEARIGDSLTYTCSACTTRTMKPFAFVLERLFPSDESDEDIIAATGEASKRTGGFFDEVRSFFTGGKDDALPDRPEEPKALPPHDPSEK